MSTPQNPALIRALLDQQSNGKIRQQLDALALHLGNQREAILTAWYTSTEQAAEVTSSTALTRIQFNDHIPRILDAFARRLRLWPEEESPEFHRQAREQLVEHGMQRWQQGYQLPELICEWGHLQTELMEALEAHAVSLPDLDSQVMPIARRALMRLSTESIFNSANQYWHLHQAEAAGHVRVLEQALTTLNELDQLRAKTWHEAAHDLRGSLSVVQGATHELQSEKMSDPQRNQFFDLLHRGVASVHVIIADLMSLAKLDAGQDHRQLASFDAGELLTDFCLTSQPLAQQSGLYLRMEGPKSLPVVGDRAKILRILQNLLLNSLKYTRRGGVTVIWEAGKDPATKNWVFCIQDTGPGMSVGTPMAHQLYEATQSRNELEESSAGIASHESRAPTVPAQSGSYGFEQPGEGIGLSIVKRLCELLDASLELETSPGEGSTFRVSVPCGYGTETEGQAQA
jgi:signal transduction histidine kinase